MTAAKVFAGPLIVTLVYLAYYYYLQLRLLSVKTRLTREYQARGEKFDRYFGQDRVMLAADRAQLNTLEHMPPFLILLWLCAVFATVQGATIAGAIYVAARIVYPFLLGERLGRNIKAKVLLATGTGYLVLTFFMGALLWAMVNG